ncbi:MAG: right-handed parallel beta-helix repeat-containing protein [Candidatus Eisenbacteria sp.]|nr:right-handed parallel beta-helix repeat-containing protein [Candidatus Eisenbacteria bacterium]
MRKLQLIRWGGVAIATLLAALAGCSDDGTTRPGGQTPETAPYTIQAWFGGPNARTGFEVAIARADSADTSAMAATVTLNGTPIELQASASTDDDALYMRRFLGYGAGTDYLLVVSLADSSDTCAFSAPALPGMTITAPGDGDEFTPGHPIAVTWTYAGDSPDSVYLELVSTGMITPVPDWVALPGSTTAYSIPASTTTDWEENADLFLILYRGGHLGTFRGHLASARSYTAASIFGPDLSLWPGAPLPPGVQLRDAIAAAPPGEANGHSFVHLLQLDPESTYVGGAVITENTCIQGNSAKIDLAGEMIVVRAEEQARFDIDHCLIVNGGASSESSLFSGGIEYQYLTRGWVFNNTFYDNFDYGLHLDLLDTQGDAVKMINNIFYGNGWSLVRNDDQPDLYIRRNVSWPGPISIGDYGEYTGCETCNPSEITPGDDLDISNRIEDPGFVKTPAPSKPGDLHLAAGSPCIGTGEDPLTGAVDGTIDKGAFPYEETP